MILGTTIIVAAAANSISATATGITNVIVDIRRLFTFLHIAYVAVLRIHNVTHH
jgi:hypothetical protein